MRKDPRRDLAALRIQDFVIPTLSKAEGEGFAVRGKMQVPRFAWDDKL